MKTKKVKQKPCKHCKKLFTPFYKTTDPVCSSKCGYEYKKFISENRKELEKEESSSINESSIKHSVWIKAFEFVFNTWVKVRDKDKPCITCGTHSGVMEAGHCYKVSTYPNMRFLEDNVHKQCYNCNREKDGDFAKYSIELPKRIGMKNYLLLLEYKNVPLKISIPELQEQIKIYKQKTKSLR